MKNIKNINDCWAAMSECTTEAEIRDNVENFPRWSGNWVVTRLNNHTVRVSNDCYDPALEVDNSDEQDYEVEKEEQDAETQYQVETGYNMLGYIQDLADCAGVGLEEFAATTLPILGFTGREAADIINDVFDYDQAILQNRDEMLNYILEIVDGNDETRNVLEELGFTDEEINTIVEEEE